MWYPSLYVVVVIIVRTLCQIRLFWGCPHWSNTLTGGAHPASWPQALALALAPPNTPVALAQLYEFAGEIAVAAAAASPPDAVPFAADDDAACDSDSDEALLRDFHTKHAPPAAGDGDDALAPAC